MVFRLPACHSPCIWWRPAKVQRYRTVGSWGPLQREVEAVVDPVVRSAQKVKQITSMVAVLFSEPITRDLLLDFVDRYWDNTHPLEKTEMGAEAASEVVMTIILAIFTAGVGVAANIAVKSGRLVKVARLLEKTASTLKRVSSLHRLPKKRGSGGFLGIFKKNKSKTKKAGVPEPDTPKKKPDVDNKDNKEYPDKDKDVGPKTTHPKVRWKGFKDPKEAYAHVNSLKNDTAKIAKQRIQGLSKEEAGRIKSEIRGWATKEDYPGIDYSKIDKAIDKFTGRELTKKDIDEIKDYVFNDKLLAPKDNIPKELQASYYRQTDQWLKLSEGKGGVNEKTFLRHELSEMLIKRNGGLEKYGQSLGRNPNFTHADAHMATDEIFDCSKFDEIFMKENF